MDIINYAVFGAIKLTESESTQTEDIEGIRE
jgi:hypothetical protein